MRGSCSSLGSCSCGSRSPRAAEAGIARRRLTPLANGYSSQLVVSVVVLSCSGHFPRVACLVQ